MDILLRFKEQNVVGALRMADQEGITFGEIVERALEQKLRATTASTIRPSPVESAVLVEQLHGGALSFPMGEIFEVPALYERVTGQSWQEVDPTRRKMLGKSFGKMVSQRSDTAQPGELVVRFNGRNRHRHATYLIEQSE